MVAERNFNRINRISHESLDFQVGISLRFRFKPYPERKPGIKPESRS